MIHLEIAPRALIEAEDIQQHYGSIQEQLASDFASVVAAALMRIQMNPSLYQAVEGNTRRCPLRRFPYSLIYRLRRDSIRVLAFAHQSRRPDYWKGR